jgi:hypothetical protein
MRTGISLMLIAAVFPLHGSADCRSPVQPAFVRELPQYAAARSVAWRDDDRLLIGTRNSGVVEYDLSAKRFRTLPGTTAIDDIENLDTDGKTVLAFNRDHTDVVYDIDTATVVHKRRKAIMRVMDLAVHGGRVAALGFSFDKNNPGGPLWLGKPGADWQQHQLLYDTSKKADARFRTAVSPYAGAVTFADANTVAVVTPFAAGVMRYRISDGASLQVLGKDMAELVWDVSQVIEHNDLRVRYDALGKRQIADDLVVLPEGPAVIVRGTSKGKAGWSLWLPSLNHTTRKWALGIGSNDPVGAHMRCDARGPVLACIVTGRVPRLALFSTAKAVSCK